MSGSETPLPQPVLVGPQPTLPKPATIKNGVILFYVSLLLGLIGGVLSMIFPAPAAPRVSPILLSVFLLLSLFFIFGIVASINAGKNWGRWWLLGLYALALYRLIPGFVLPGLAKSAPLTPLNYGLSLMQLVLQGIGLGFLFAPASSAWFRSFR